MKFRVMETVETVGGDAFFFFVIVLQTNKCMKKRKADNLLIAEDHSD